LTRAGLASLKLVVEEREGISVAPTDARVIISDPEGRPQAYGSRVGAECCVAVPDRGTFRFQPGLEVVVAEQNPGADEESVLDAYRSAALPMAVQVVLGSQVLHASGVVAPDRGVLSFCGLSHTGKSTLAYGLSLRGYQIWADDILAFDASDGEAVCSIRLPFRFNLRAASAAHFALVGPVSPAADDDADWTRAPLASIYTLERTDMSSACAAVRRLAPEDAFAAVLEHAFFFQPQTTEERRLMMHDYLELIARIPVFAVKVGPNLETLDALLDEVEASIAKDG
jgi:hypothetical protein